ncbi:uncharacterized protein LOC119176032 isoform X1 [Rhipicephalus microplus]|uniref:uncharacterized protein LOC119176032 isoform X1 n=1 Tax=Rhipicephalus microplus TaxID=6941 RepID=UPI003F6BF6C1
MEIGLSEPCMPKEWWPNRMNQLCKVCGEPAAGYHFGAFTCEGCKSFFGRTYNNLAALGECKNSGQCVINKKNRTSCKSCRLKKCLMVGMSKSGSRYGRRSNWFKIHCLIQDQAEMSSRIAEQHHQLGAAASAHQLTALYDKDVLGGFGAKAEEGNGASSPLSSSDKPPSSPASYPPPSSSASTFASTPSAFETKSSNGESPTNADALAYHSMSPVSPISPLHPSKFFFHPGAGVFFGKAPVSHNGLSKFFADAGGAMAYPYSPRFMPFGALKPYRDLLHPSTLLVNGECLADLPEQERPIDLSVRKPCSPSASPAGGHAEELDTPDSDVKPALQAPCSSGAEIPLDLRSAKK